MGIKVDPDRCTGCRLCLQICAIEHFNEINPKKAALRIEARFPEPGKYCPNVCIQCGKCAEICPEEAIQKNKRGVYRVDTKKCTLCGICISECPEGVIFQHPDLSHVLLCDFCFECTDICNTSAIMGAEKSEEMQAKEVM